MLSGSRQGGATPTNCSAGATARSLAGHIDLDQRIPGGCPPHSGRTTVASQLHPRTAMTHDSRSDQPPPTQVWIPSIVIGSFALFIVQIGAFFVGAWGGLDGTFRGPDSYMRVHRVLTCVGGVACEGGMLDRSNAPYGEALHWPWLWDWVILATSAPLQLFLDFRTAVLVAAYALPLLMGVLAIVALTHAARRLGVGSGLPYVGLLLVTQPLLVFLFAYSRPDHHGLQAALFSTALFGALASLLDSRKLWPALSGIAMGTAIWISTEGLITAVPLLAAVGLSWTMMGGPEKAAVNRRLALSAFATLLVGLAIDGPAAGRASVEFDRLSIVHMSLFALIGGFWALVGRWNFSRPLSATARAAVTLAGAVVTFGAMSVAFPGFQRGPAAEIPEPLWTHWLNYTSEYVPIVQRLGGIDLLATMAPFLFAFPVSLWAAAKGSRGQRYLWMSIAGALLWFQGLAVFQQVRWSTYTHLIAVLPVAWFLGRVLLTTEGVRHSLLRAGLRVSIVCMVALGPSIALGGMSLLRGRRSYDNAHGCEAREVVSTVAGLRTPSGGPATILAPIFWGPELLFRTGQSVVATPYHRNVDGIMDSYRVMSGDPEGARTLMASRGITHIVVCSQIAWIPYVELDAEGTFFGDLVGGVIPDWVLPVSTSEDVGGIRIFEVTAGGIS